MNSPFPRIRSCGTYDQFRFYTDPVGEKGVGYLFDNLIVRENPLPDTDSDIDADLIF